MQRTNTRTRRQCWTMLAALSLAVGLLMTGPVIADFTLTTPSETVINALNPHAPDDLLSMSILFGPPNLGEDVLGLGPVVDVPAPAIGFGGFDMDASSWDLWPAATPPGALYALYFSVDPASTGYPASKVYNQFYLDVAAGDIFEGMTWLYTPTPPPFPQPLPFGVPSRAPFGLGANWHAPTVLNCGLAGTAPENGGDHRNLALIPSGAPSGLFDDVDGFDCFTPGPALIHYSSFTGVTGNPLPFTANPGDIIVSTGSTTNIYALSLVMGLDLVGGLGSDDIDALTVFDLDGVPQQSGGGVDYAIFSLRAGSATLGFTGLSPSDVFITDFTGGFDIFAYGHELGLSPVDDLDGLSFGRPQPPPAKCADQDGDGDVDLGDFSIFILCFGGAGNVPPTSCPPFACVDFDLDGDVDLADFTVFSLCFSGSGGPIPASCPLGC